MLKRGISATRPVTQSITITWSLQRVLPHLAFVGINLLKYHHLQRTLFLLTRYQAFSRILPDNTALIVAPSPKYLAKNEQLYIPSF